MQLSTWSAGQKSRPNIVVLVPETTPIEVTIAGAAAGAVGNFPNIPDI
jgi:hypothetical protein